jgi:mono/diheme cytochrome c family protein
MPAFRAHRLTLLLLGGACTTPSITAPASPPVDDGPCVNTFAVDVAIEDTGDHSHQDEHGAAPGPLEDILPVFLSETGLYEDITSKSVHPAMLSYTPQFQLWSDGLEKSRWTYVPECDTIDSSDPDSWRFPVGTRFFKEFRIDGVRIETRLIERVGPGPRDFAYASYLWDTDEGEAVRVDATGLPGANGTDHNIPSKQDCWSCHGSAPLGGGVPARGLGFSVLQLSHQGDGTTLDDLVAAGMLSHPPDAGLDFPGEGLDREALGYLHANCGSCHNSSADGLPQIDLDFWVDSTMTTPEGTATWKTAIDQDLVLFSDQHVTARIASGLPDQSAATYRMAQRGNNAQMPPIASDRVDEEGLDLIRAWIETLP